MRLDGGDVLHRGDDESCISADDLTAAAVVGGEPAAEIFNQTYTASYFSRTVRATFATAALLFHFTDLPLLDILTYTTIQQQDQPDSSKDPENFTAGVFSAGTLSSERSGFRADGNVDVSPTRWSSHRRGDVELSRENRPVTGRQPPLPSVAGTAALAAAANVG